MSVGWSVGRSRHGLVQGVHTTFGDRERLAKEEKEKQKASRDKGERATWLPKEESHRYENKKKKKKTKKKKK